MVCIWFDRSQEVAAWLQHWGVSIPLPCIASPVYGFTVSSLELGAVSPQGIAIDNYYNRTPIHRTHTVAFLLPSVFCQG